MPGLLTSGNESGSWPTPLASNAKGVDYQYDQGDHSKPRLTLCGMAKMWPTIRSSDGERGGRGDLIQAVRGNENSHFKLWPTPHGFSPDGRTNGPSGNELGRAVNRSLWGTPRASDGMKNKLRDIPADKNCRARLEDQVAQQEGPGGSLNPTWVEWLMGWPLGWTDSARSATARFRQWLRSHGGLCADAESDDEMSDIQTDNAYSPDQRSHNSQG